MYLSPGVSIAGIFEFNLDLLFISCAEAVEKQVSKMTAKAKTARNSEK